MLLHYIILTFGLLFSCGIFACSEEPDYNTEVILSLELNQFLISDQIIAYQNSTGEILYPLADLLSALEVDVSDNSSRISGSIFGSKNKVLIDPKTGEASFKGVAILNKSYPQLAKDEELACYLETLYVSKSILKILLPAEFEYDASLLKTVIAPSRLFPIQIEQKKQALQKRQGWIGHYQDKAITRQYTDIAFSWNVATFSAQLNSELSTSNFSLETGGRFLYHDIGLFASTDLYADRARLNVVGSRRILDPDYQPFLSYYEFGDTSISSKKGVSRSHIGTGVSFTNRPFNLLADRDMDFSGTVSPNWFVEMYINGILMGFAEPNENNRFSFDDVSLFPGKNLVKYVFYGPQGQIESTETEYFLDSLSHNKNKLFYDFDFVSAGSGFLQSILGQEKDKSKKYSLFHLNLSYGVTDSIAFKVDSWHKRYDKTDNTGINSATILRPGVKARFSDIVQFEYYQPFYLDNTKHFASQVKLNLYPLKFLNLWADADFYQDGYTDLENAESLAYRYKAGARYFMPFIRTRISGEIESTRSANTGNVSINSNLALNSAFNGFNSALLVERKQNSNNVSYKSSASFSYSQNGLTQQASISGMNEDSYFGIDKISYSNRFSFLDAWSNIFRSRYSFKNDDFNLSNSILYTSNYYALGAQFSYDKNTGFSGGFSFNTSLIRNDSNDFGLFNRASPTTSFANVGIKVIKADGTESYVKQGAVKVDGQIIDLNTSKKSLTNASGTIIPGIEPYKWVNIEIDESALEDTSWSIKTKPVSVMIEPGGMEKIIFTVMETGEIDGMVLIGDKLKSKKGIKILLVTTGGEKVKETVSAFDGFYLFDKVEPGEYAVKIDPAYLERKQLQASDKIITLKDGNMFALSNDFILMPIPSEASLNHQTAADPTAALPTEQTVKNNWLLNQKPENYTLQLLAISKQRKPVLDKLITKYPRLQKDLHYFTQIKNGEQKLILIYGSFATASAAEEASKLLPPAFHKFWLRRLKSLQNNASAISQQTRTSKLIEKTKSTLAKERAKTADNVRNIATSKSTLSDSSQWIKKQKPDNFTLQLAVISAQRKSALMSLIKKHKQLHYYRCIKKGQEKYTLVYGSFASRTLAKQAIEKLPEAFNKPWLRTFKALQSGLKT